MRIGILGGSFNPPHIGHLILAEKVRQKLKLDKVIFVPAYIPPLKKEKDLLGAEDRLHMVELAVRDNSYFEVSRLEIERGGVSYTVDTLKAFKEILGKDAELFFIAGSDVITNLNRWKKIDEILRLAKFVIVIRKGFKTTSLPKAVEKIEMETIDVSSSQIREHVRRGESVRYLVPEAVRKLILKKNFYFEK